MNRPKYLAFGGSPVNCCTGLTSCADINIVARCADMAELRAYLKAPDKEGMKPWERHAGVLFVLDTETLEEETRGHLKFSPLNS